MNRGPNHHSTPRTAVIIACGLMLGVLMPRAASSDSKKLEVISAQAVIRLDPDERSPAVETVPRGAILSLASDVRLKSQWLYVYFTSFRSGISLSGYIRESEVRKLYPVLKVTLISSEDEILDPKAIDLDAPYQPNLEWGTTKSSILRTEGRPYDESGSGGLEVLQYKREIMNKRCLVEYVLDGDRLVTTRFHLMENYAEKGRYIDDYNTIRVFLTARIGPPRSDRMTWQDSPPNARTEPLPEALRKGEVEFSSEWVFGDTSVHLVLAGAENRVVFGAEIADLKARQPVSF